MAHFTGQQLIDSFTERFEISLAPIVKNALSTRLSLQIEMGSDSPFALMATLINTTPAFGELRDRLGSNADFRQALQETIDELQSLLPGDDDDDDDDDIIGDDDDDDDDIIGDDDDDDDDDIIGDDDDDVIGDDDDDDDIIGDDDDDDDDIIGDDDDDDDDDIIGDDDDDVIGDDDDDDDIIGDDDDDDDDIIGDDDDDDGVETLTLTSALAADTLPEQYLLTDDQLFMEQLTVNAAREINDQVDQIIAAADNADDINKDDIFVYTLSDSFEELWAAAAANDPILAGAQHYALSDPEGSDLGSLTPEQIAFVEAADNFADDFWVWTEDTGERHFDQEIEVTADTTYNAAEGDIRFNFVSSDASTGAQSVIIENFSVGDAIAIADWDGTGSILPGANIDELAFIFERWFVWLSGLDEALVEEVVALDDQLQTQIDLLAETWGDWLLT